MNVYEKISVIKTAIQEIKKISQKTNNNSSLEAKIIELNKEILTLKEGINENIEKLEKILEEENA
tara:strand:+ start:27 stop:221 length:195 start_codon:yes stop_codon:yes gene_type:complete